MLRLIVGRAVLLTAAARMAHAGLPQVHATKETVLTLCKSHVRDLVFFPATRCGEVEFRLQEAHPERHRAMLLGSIADGCGRLVYGRFPGGLHAPELSRPSIVWRRA